MKIKSLVSAALVSAASLSAHAETTFNELINNTATLDYTVAGQTQTQVPASVSFRVDRKIIFNVTTPTPASLAKESVGTAQVITYTLSNLSNAPIGMKLALTDLDSGENAYTGLPNDTTDGVSGTDDIEYAIYLDVNDNGTYESGTDNVVINAASIQTFAQQGVTGGDPDTIRVHVVITPKQGKENDVFAHELAVTAVETNGDPLPNDNAAAWTPDTAQTVLANATDTVNDRGAVSVASADLAVTKSVVVVSNPAGFSGPAKAIPGATVRYTITIVNSGSLDAANVVVKDAIPTQFDLSTDAITAIETSSIMQDNSSTDITNSAGDVRLEGDPAVQTIVFPSQTVPAGEQVTASFEAVLL